MVRSRSNPHPVGAPDAALHRSGAVAAMLGMPVTTLRVWERRYALTHAAASPGGQRLYSAVDVRRLTLLKQLVDRGHAVGSLAALDMAQLQAVAATDARAREETRPARPSRPARPAAAPAWRLAVVGPALGARLQRTALLRLLGRRVDVLGPFDDVPQAARKRAGAPPDAWLVHVPQLHAGWWAEVGERLTAPRRGRSRAPVPLAVVYGFAADSVCEALAARGVALLREPQPDAALAQWLRLWSQASVASPSAGVTDDGRSPPAQPRRWDDAALADFAARSTTVACECPHHVAELLTQLSRFEAYSAQCTQRSPQDGELHAFLGRVAGDARVLFEDALERVALHEGLLLPLPAQPGGRKAR